MIFKKNILFHNLFFMHFIILSTKTESFFLSWFKYFLRCEKVQIAENTHHPQNSTKLHKRSIADLWLLPFTIKARPPVTQKKILSFRGVFLLYYYKKKFLFPSLKFRQNISKIFSIFIITNQNFWFTYIKLERNFARNSFLSGWAW